MRAIYPGSFDPPHLGHLDIIRRGSRLYDELIVAALDNPLKAKRFFSTAERVALLGAITQDLPNVHVETFTELVAAFAQQRSAVLLKSLRGPGDLEYEAQMAHLNRGLYPEVETVFLLAAPEWSYVSSTRVRELHSLDADVSSLVPPATLNALREMR